MAPMDASARPRHTLLLYRSSERADDALRSMCSRALEGGSLVTVVVLAREEDARNGCCDTRSVLWNRVGKVADSVAREAVARGADEIVLSDPRGSGLGRLELRRLRRSSAVPVRG